MKPTRERVQVNGHAPDLERYAFFLRYPPQHGSERRRPKGDATVATYCYTVQRYLRFLNGGDVGQATAEAFVLHLEAGNSPRSVGRHIYALQSYFAFQKVPLELGAPAYPKRLPRWFTDAEWQRLLGHGTKALRETAPPRKARERALFNRAALMVYGGAGLRLSEGLGLRREHV
ncbi:MAG: phage integrase N-terminal SAM-like domain-containing protein, partial [Chloroflexota bacterium]|nr:phage integrase N-terminal SAM-like domain-containing protein [Chloroflexota bacterium]